MADIKKLQQSVAGLYTLTLDAQRIVTIRPVSDKNPSERPWLNDLENFTDLLLKLIHQPKGITGVLYYCPINASEDKYQSLFQAAKSPLFINWILDIAASIMAIKSANIPVTAIIDQTLDSIQLAPMLWATHVIALKSVRIQLPDCRLGIFPGLGVSVIVASKVPTEQAAALLLKASPLSASDAHCFGLINEIAGDGKEANLQARSWMSQGRSAKHQNALETLVSTNEDEFERQMAATKKKVNPLLPGIKHCIDVLEVSRVHSYENTLTAEAVHYLSVLKESKALSMMRTNYYGVIHAKKRAVALTAPDLSIKKVSVLGAGMMGAGIAYEAARAGLLVCLKDTEIRLAKKGKQYSEKCCDKLIQLGKSTEEEKTALLASIHPTDKAEDLAGSDVIIEAIFEDKALKEKVISESTPFLKNSGFFASNTTSLPITELASHTSRKENFVGMHFFSPVDRMPLVEIIRGQATSEKTLAHAVQLALKLQKVPIVVHDSPAFFTSRIFFNYLLEAVTMLLEGIPAVDIEREAMCAGFAVSPLAVLDEISIPLMLHVYDQLPVLTSSQKRCYQYLAGLVKAGRTGRKSAKGLYDYDTSKGTKAVWQDPSITPLAKKEKPETIQKRLLHVMALDSYRLLDEGVLDQPIDGDIGSTMGVGFPVHTGGVFAYIDEVGIVEFVSDCLSFFHYGEQWHVPASMFKIVKKASRFYDRFTANWPVKK